MQLLQRSDDCLDMTIKEIRVDKTSLRSVIALSTHAHARIALAVIMFGAPNNWFVVVIVFTAAWHLTLPILPYLWGGGLQLPALRPHSRAYCAMLGILMQALFRL